MTATTAERIAAGTGGLMDVTREQLAAALARPRVLIQIDRLSARDGDDYTEGHVRYPYAAADVIIEGIREVCPEPARLAGPEDDDGPCEFIRDPELAVMAACVAALDGIGDGESAGKAHGPFWRVLYYLAARYGYVLCTED